MGDTKDKKSGTESEKARKTARWKETEREGKGSTKRIGTQRGQAGKEIRD